MTSVELSFWEPGALAPQVRPAVSVADVTATADDLLVRYQAAGDTLPGLELARDDAGGSLSIAVAPDGWALVHTDAEFDQHCSQSPDLKDDTSVDIRWEETTPIPRQWFVPKDTASRAVGQWLTDGSLTPEITWSDQCQ